MVPVEVTFFALTTLMTLIGGVITVAAKNPIRGAMGLLVTILGIAGMYLLLAAELLAAVQVVVYAGAVVILFLFVIMLLGPSASESTDARGAISRYFGAGVFLISAVGLLFVITRLGGAALTRLPPPSPGMGTIEVIGRELFTTNLVSFQITGILLLIAVLGAMAVARGGIGAATKPTTTKALPPTRAELKSHEGTGHGHPSHAPADRHTEVES
jgi:NADH-quinone oxidoreductase subunit J